VRRIHDAGTSVVLVTHDVEEAERLCDRIVVMDRGRIVARGTPAEVAAGASGAVTVTFTDTDLDTRPLRSLPGARRVTRHGPQVRVVGDGPLLAHVGAHLVAVGRPALDLDVHRPSLEARFIELTKESRQ
jgi:ABC-2 type transport system ATP-binding protein